MHFRRWACIPDDPEQLFERFARVEKALGREGYFMAGGGGDAEPGRKTVAFVDYNPKIPIADALTVQVTVVDARPHEIIARCRASRTAVPRVGSLLLEHELVAPTLRMPTEMRVEDINELARFLIGLGWSAEAHEYFRRVLADGTAEARAAVVFLLPELGWRWLEPELLALKPDTDDPDVLAAIEQLTSHPHEPRYYLPQHDVEDVFTRLCEVERSLTIEQLDPLRSIIGVPRQSKSWGSASTATWGSTSGSMTTWVIMTRVDAGVVATPTGDCDSRIHTLLESLARVPSELGDQPGSLLADALVDPAYRPSLASRVASWIESESAAMRYEALLVASCAEWVMPLVAKHAASETDEQNRQAFDALLHDPLWLS